MVCPRKVKHRTTIRSSNFTSRYLPQRIENRNPNGYLYENVHNSIIHNGQDVLYPHKALLLSHKNEGSPDNCDMEGPGRHISNISQSQRTSPVIPLTWGPRGATFTETEVDSGAGVECSMGAECQFGVMENLEIDGEDGNTTVRMYLLAVNCTLTNG